MILFLLTSLFFRLLGLNASAIWYDQAISRYRAQHMLLLGNYWDMLLVPFSNGPLWLMRIPAFLFSILALWLAWKLMDALAFTRRQRITSCIALAILPGLIWMAQDARCYAALSCAYLAAVWFAVKDRPLGLAAMVGLLAYLHMTGMGLAAAALFVALNQISVRRTALAALGTIAWIPLLIMYVLKSEDSSAALFWLKEFDPFKTLGQAAFVNTVPGVVAGFFILLAMVCMVWRKELHPIYRIAAFPLIILIVFSVLVAPVMYYRPLMPILIPLCLLFGAGLTPSRPGWWRWIPAGIAACLLFFGVINWDPSARGGHVDEMAVMIDANWQEGDQLVYATGTVAEPLDFYLHRPGCILDWTTNPNLTLPSMDLEWPECPPGTPQAGRTWLIWPDDPLLTAQRPEGLLVASSWGGWEFPRIDVILIEK